MSNMMRATKVRVRAAAESLPPGLANKVNVVYVASKVLDRKRTERIFDGAATDPEFLPSDRLEELSHAYPKLPSYGYDPGALAARGRARAAELLGMPGGKAAISYLELGCWDGMVGWALHAAGRRVTCIDARTEGFDHRALDAGVDLRQMDAEALAIPDSSIDFAYSYDAFEHFSHPDQVLRELVRVVKPGGHVYLDFGPLYLSSFGEHAYRSIPIPYCHVLWPGDVLNAFARSRGVPEIDFSHVNRWRIGQFRDLFSEHSRDLSTVWKREALDVDNLGLIRRYPTCFKSKTDDFEDLVVKNVRVLLLRKG